LAEWQTLHRSSISALTSSFPVEDALAPAGVAAFEQAETNRTTAVSSRRIINPDFFFMRVSNYFGADHSAITDFIIV
jgi:seryl-tRNA(Sec) selenium transferase